MLFVAIILLWQRPATTSATLLWMRSRYYLSKDLVVADYVAAAAVPLLLSHWHCGCNPGTTSAIIWPWVIIVLWLRSRYYLPKDLVVADYVAAAAVPLLLSHWYCGCNPGTTSAISWPWLVIVLWLRPRYYLE